MRTGSTHNNFRKKNLEAVPQDKCLSTKAQMNWSEGEEMRIKENDKETQKEEADVHAPRHMDVLKNKWTLANKSSGPCHNHEKLDVISGRERAKSNRQDDRNWNKENVQNPS